MSGKAKTSGVSRSAVGDDHDHDRGDSEPKTKKQRLLTAAASDQNAETEEDLYQKAVSLVFGGELYAKLLRYAGPEGIAHLRGDRKWRKAMDELPADDLRGLHLPVVKRPDDVDLTLLRELLTEPAPTALIDQASGSWTLNELGRKILVRSPLTSNAVIRNVVNSGNDELLDGSICHRLGNSAEILADLVRLGKPKVLWKIPYHPAATCEILSAILVRLPQSKLSQDHVRTAVNNIANHRNTGGFDLDFLSTHEDSYVRRCVAQNRSTPSYLLRKLSSDTVTRVRAAVARNPKTPRDRLVSLSVDPSHVVRAAVARNPNAYLDLLTKLAQDDDSDVLYALAQSQKKHFDLIFDEARKRHRSTIAFYSDNSDALDRLVGMDDGSYDHLVARNPNTSQEVLDRLAASDDERVRMSVAGNKNTSAAALQQLLHDSSCKFMVAENENTPIHILEALAKEEDSDVLGCIAENKSVTPEILRGIISSTPPDSLPYTVLENESLPIADLVGFAATVLEKDIDLPKFLKVSLSDRLEYEKDLPVSIVVVMSKKDRELQRLAATRSNLPVKDILRLSKIEDQDIRKSLQFNPLLQIAVDKLYHLLSSGGVGSGAHFTDGENWW